MVATSARRRWRIGFPYAAPTWPGTVERHPPAKKLGADYDTEWARSPAARHTRAVLLEALLRPAVGLLAAPRVTGLDRLFEVSPPAIFVANHASHIDTPLLLSCLPPCFRERTAVAAAADYFFDRTYKAVLSALAFAAFPVERTTVSRRSLELAEALVADGWSLIVFPEGGRTPDGWAREFRAGAAFIASRTGAPIVPVHLEGTRRVARRGSGRVTRARTNVTFGSPIHPGDTPARELGEAVQHSVAALADEQATDWWSARRRAAQGRTPPLTGPEVSPWRRAWALGEGRRPKAGVRWPP